MIKGRKVLIEYDDEVDALYIQVRDGKIAYTEIRRDGFHIDYDEEDRVIGIEILDVSREGGKIGIYEIVKLLFSEE